MIIMALEEITNLRLQGDTYSQASLPVRFGGLGIRKTVELALPAYLASVHSVEHLITTVLPDFNLDEIVNPCILSWRKLSNSDPPTGVCSHSQRHWDEPICKNIFSSLLSTQNNTTRARLLAASSQIAGCWLHAFPISSLGNLLDANTLRISIGLRLGAPICESHRCHCGAEVDCLGYHGLSCRQSKGRLSRHASLNSTIQRALSSAAVPSILEPPGLARDDGKRPDGMSLIPWATGKSLIWDVTCVDTMANSYISGTSQRSGHAALQAEERKIRKYSALQDFYHFVPIGVETFGSLGPSAELFLAKLGKLILSQTLEKRSSEYLRQKISIDLQRGNAASVMGTLPNQKALDEIFYILGKDRSSKLI